MTVVAEAVDDGLSFAVAHQVLVDQLEQAARAGVDVAELLVSACTEATRRLPAGMSLTDARPGSWESAALDQLVDPAAVSEGTRPGVLDVECLSCGAPAGQQCWNRRTYDDLQQPHRERAQGAASAVWCGPELGWMLA